MKAITSRPVTSSGLPEWAAHRHLEGLSSRLHLLPVTGADERPLGECVDVFQEDDDPVALEDGSGCGRSSSVTIAMQARDCVADRLGLTSTLNRVDRRHRMLSSRFPAVVARKGGRSGEQPGGRCAFLP
jgi:hypothetical protein